MELFKSIRLMMAEGRFIQAERTLLDFSLHHEEELSIEFFHELFEVRRQLGKDFPFHELDKYFKKLSEKNLFQEIDDLLVWWSQKNPKIESVAIYQWKLLLQERKGSLHNLETDLKSFGMFLLKGKYWAHMDLYKSYYEKYFKNNYDFVFVLVLYQIQTNQFSATEKILEQFVEDELIRGKRTTKTDDDIDLILTLLDHATERGTLEIWKSFLSFQQTKNFNDVEIKKFIEAFIYFENFSLQLVLLRLLDQWGQEELATLLAQTLKVQKNYDFIIIEKYFAHDLKPYFIQKKKRSDENFKSSLSAEDLKLDKSFKRSTEKELEESHLFGEEEALVVAALKYQQINFDQALDLMVSMLQMSFPVAAREIGMKFRNQELDSAQKLKLNYLLLQVFHILKDYRAGLDIALDSLSLATSSEDILAFTYAEADFYYFLGERKKAKNLYLSILSLVGNYRMTKERLRELDEV